MNKGEKILLLIVLVSFIGLMIVAEYFPFMLEQPKSKPVLPLTFNQWLIIGTPAYIVWILFFYKLVKKWKVKHIK